MTRRDGRRMALVPLMALAAVALRSTPALADPPPNDDFDAATVVAAVPFSDSLDTSEATTAPDDPDCAGNGHTVWYAFTPASDLTITANTFGSDYDTTLSAYTGTRGALDQVACNDDFIGLQSKITFFATAGVTYFFMAGSFFDSPGGHLELAIRELASAPNDDFDDATVITVLPFTDDASTVEATTASDDPDCFGNGHSVWYAITPASNTTLRFDARGSDYDTTLSAYTGSRGALTQVACLHGSRLSFAATAGVTYFVMVASFEDAPGGELVLNVREIPPPMVLGVSIDPEGTVSRSGLATIHGTVTCSRDAPGIFMTGTLTQRIGKRVATGSFNLFVDCTEGVGAWEASVVGETGTYRRGDARARVGLNFFDPDREEVVTAGTSRLVRLS
ncbi:MAG TPA: hypothetical protein VNP94_09485 [Actinomycetota bacterium]|nr:hypothetical protein [Actinomycetota bacterium]